MRCSSPSARRRCRAARGSSSAGRVGPPPPVRCAAERAGGRRLGRPALLVGLAMAAEGALAAAQSGAGGFDLGLLTASAAGAAVLARLAVLVAAAAVAAAVAPARSPALSAGGALAL